MEYLEMILAFFIMYGIPLGAFIYFLASLILFLIGKNSGEPIAPEKMRARKINLIVSSILFALVLIIYGGLTILLMIAVQNM